jgi:hypothetical protein
VLHAVPYGGVSEKETALLKNTGTIDAEEQADLIDALLRQREPVHIERITALLKAGKDPRRIIDVMQLAVGQIVLETTRDPANFAMPMHCYEYCNTLGWFYDNFDHPRRLRFLFVGGSFINCTAWHQKNIGEMQPATIKAPRAGKLTASQLLDRVEDSICALNGPESAAWTQAYLDEVPDRAPLVQRIALMAARMGNDTHNQEIAQCMLEDAAKNQSPDHDRLIVTAAYHTAAHRKYGDPLEPSRRFGQALGIEELK